jgi:hypothetical protein
MHKAVLGTLIWMLTGSIAMSAQTDKKVRAGLLATGSIKYQVIPTGEKRYLLFGSAGIGAVARIGGNSEEALSFLPKLMFIRENISYRHTFTANYHIESLNLVVNPEIIFPTRYERLEVTGGIGIDWVIESILGLSLKEGPQLQARLDEAQQIIQETRRPLIPFVSVGMLYRAGERLNLQAALRQDMRNAFPDGTEVTIATSSAIETLRLSHQPTRLSISLYYLF